jgi:hypothetical protein
VTWIPQVLALFKRKGQVTSQELATIAGKTIGGDAVTRCRQLGLPVEAAGVVNGSRPPHKLYVLDSAVLWFALQEAVRQIDRYALLLNTVDQSAQCRTFRNPGAWIEHLRRLASSDQTKSPQ